MTETARKAAAKPPIEPIEGSLERMAPKEIIALMLWQNRHREPSLSVTIGDRDKKGLEDCLAYLGVKAEVGILRRPDKVVVALVEAGSGKLDANGRGGLGNAIKPVENNEADYDRGEQARTLQQVRATAPAIAQAIRAQIVSRTMSDDTMQEAARALDLLARA